MPIVCPWLHDVQIQIMMNKPIKTKFRTTKPMQSSRLSTWKKQFCNPDSNQTVCDTYAIERYTFLHPYKLEPFQDFLQWFTVFCHLTWMNSWGWLQVIINEFIIVMWNGQKEQQIHEKSVGAAAAIPSHKMGSL